MRFEILDAATQRRLRDVQCLGGAAEAAVFCQCQRMAKQAKVD
jgi:hypothetical protein